MPNRPPKSYDEIVRRTVPEPDSSWRPSQDQVRRAYEGFRALDADEQAIFDDVREALLSAGFDPTQLTIEVDRDRVLLRGQVRDRTALARIPEIVRHVDGVNSVCDQLVIGAG